MVRDYRPAAQRRAQILDAAMRLFLTKGYTATTIDDILGAVGIAKGTLYYHFGGKEEILTGIVERACATIAARAEQIAATDAPPLERFLQVLSTAKVDEESMALAEQFDTEGHSGNAEFQLQSLAGVVNALTPVLTRLVEEGLGSDFHTDQPREMVQIILASGSLLLDGGILPADEATLAARQQAVMSAGALLLGVPPAALARVREARPEQA